VEIAKRGYMLSADSLLLRPRKTNRPRPEIFQAEVTWCLERSETLGSTLQLKCAGGLRRKSA
jgi:hypothetical protein